MKIVIEPTTTVVNLDGVPLRLWRGISIEGEHMDVYVYHIATSSKPRQCRLEAQLALDNEDQELENWAKWLFGKKQQ
jgi:hypothetical protein